MQTPAANRHRPPPPPPLSRVRRARRARGQALVLAVALLGVLCLGAILLFNTGQTVNAKVRLTNATDAAAYSIAAEQARAMNFAAYMNRGRVANEVAIAQMVSMFSWINQLHAHAGLFSAAFQTLSSIPIIGVVFTPLLAVYEGVRQALNAVRTPVVMPVTEAVVEALDTLDGIYAEAAAAAIANATTLDGAEVGREVLRRNDPDAEFVPTGLAHLLDDQLPAARRTFLESHDLEEDGSPAPGMDRYRNVVMESRDYFSRDRSSRLAIADPVEFDMPVLPIAGAVVNITNDLVTEGGTDLVEYDRWAALDTLSFDIHVDVYAYVGRCTWTPWGEECIRVKQRIVPEVELKTPMGWGGAMAVEQDDNQSFRPGIYDDSGFFSIYEGHMYAPYNGVRGMPGWLAEQDPAVTMPWIGDPSARRGDEFLTTYRGLRDYDDVQAARARTPDDGPVFTVYARRADDGVRTSDIAGLGGREGTATHLAGAAAGDAYTALASSQVYFARPVSLSRFARIFRGDQRAGAEAGSLFSPYWQARLVETPVESRNALGIASP